MDAAAAATAPLPHLSWGCDSLTVRRGTGGSCLKTKERAFPRRVILLFSGLPGQMMTIPVGDEKED